MIIGSARILPITLVYVCALIWFAGTQPTYADTRVALVVGNSDYQYIPRLTNPTNDAKLIAETLTGLGFKLVGGGAQLDVNKAQFDQAVQDFGNAALNADVALFYYAGHGVQVNGANYLVPISANPTKQADVDFQMLDVNLVLRQMEGARTHLNIVVLDACRNNPFGGRGLRAANGGLAQIQAPEGTIISFATQPGNVAQDGADGDSPYSKALAKSMRKPGLDIFRTFNDVGLSVSWATNGEQQPWMSMSPITGEFHFVALPDTPKPDLMVEQGRYSDAKVAQFPDSPLRKDAEQGIAALAAAPAPDQIAWDMVKDSKDPDELRRFIQRFPNSAQHSKAEQRIALLSDEALKITTTSPTDPHELARALQFELKRVGCFYGAVNGEFDDATRSAWHDFTRRTAIAMSDDLSSDSIKAVRGIDRRVCPLACGTGEHGEGERCVANAPAPKRAEAAPEHEPVRPNRPAAGTPRGDGKCFSFQGKQYCE